MSQYYKHSMIQWAFKLHNRLGHAQQTEMGCNQFSGAFQYGKDNLILLT